jgi:hypothetical protein
MRHLGGFAIARVRKRPVTLRLKAAEDFRILQNQHKEALGMQFELVVLGDSELGQLVHRGPSDTARASILIVISPREPQKCRSPGKDGRWIELISGRTDSQRFLRSKPKQPNQPCLISQISNESKKYCLDAVFVLWVATGTHLLTIEVLLLARGKAVPFGRIRREFGIRASIETASAGGMDLPAH